MKTYVCSDIHAHWKTLELFLNDLKEDDRVFFLGDAEDKGPDPMKCLLYLMKDQRFKMVLGNHDYMFWRVVTEINNNTEYPNRDILEEWLDMNYGWVTWEAYMKLDEKTQMEILDYFEECPLCIKDLEVKGRKYDLCHTYMWNYFEEKDPSLKTISTVTAENFVWVRPEFPPHYFWIDPEKTIIAGHTITYFITGKTPYEIYHDKPTIEESGYINIDCGMAADDPKNSRFAVLCLDDLSVKYYPCIKE